MQKLKVFLSYAREDSKPVGQIYDRLKLEGFAPWMDVKDLLPGSKWPEATEHAIRDAHIFLVCLSRNSVNKRGVIQKEIVIALDAQKEKLDSDIYVIPARLDPCDLPGRLAHFQAADLFDAKGWESLMVSMHCQKEVLFAPADQSRSSEGHVYHSFGAVIPNSADKYVLGRVGIRASALADCAKRGMSTQVAQFAYLVEPTLSSPIAMFRGLRRPGSLPVRDEDSSTLIYVSRPMYDVHFSDYSGGPIKRTPAPKGLLFVVFVRQRVVDVSPNPLSGVIAHWSWVEEDSSNLGLPSHWRDRYGSRLLM